MQISNEGMTYRVTLIPVDKEPKAGGAQCQGPNSGLLNPIISSGGTSV